MKKITFVLLVSVLGAIILFANPVGAKESTESLSSKSMKEIKEELLDKGVDEDKVHELAKKIQKSEKLESDKYLENTNKVILATQDDPDKRIEFSDGSFIESSIEDVTEEENENLITPLGIDQIGGTQENRTLKVSHTAVWGKQSFKVKIYFPLQGYSEIKQAYDWYYLGAVSGTDYQGIYRKRETATQDAVAIQKLKIGISGLGYLAKVEFRIRDGRYWMEYSA